MTWARHEGLPKTSSFCITADSSSISLRVASSTTLKVIRHEPSWRAASCFVMGESSCGVHSDAVTILNSLPPPSRSSVSRSQSPGPRTISSLSIRRPRLRTPAFFEHILPIFTKKTGIEVRVVAVGTGQALKNAEKGDGDVVLVHSQPDEEKFVAD